MTEITTELVHTKDTIIDALNKVHELISKAPDLATNSALRERAVTLLSEAVSIRAELQDQRSELFTELQRITGEISQQIIGHTFNSRFTATYLTKAVEQELPDVFAKFYPKRYEGIGGYHSPKLAAASLTAIVAELHELGIPKLGTAMKIMLPALDYLADKRMPMFFVAPKLLEAVKRSDFQDEIDWTALKLPYEHGCFILPHGGLVHPSDGECACIFWSRIQPNQNYPCLTAKIVNQLKFDCKALGLVAYTTKNVYYNSNLTDAVRPTIKMRNLFYKYGSDRADSSSGLLDEPLRKEDEPFIEQMGCIIFGVFLAMKARAGLLTEGARLKTVKKEKSMLEYWSPNIIGRDYQYKQSGKGGSHASPRMHWRRGHFRRQHFGISNTETKTIWLEPCLVSAGEA